MYGDLSDDRERGLDSGLGSPLLVFLRVPVVDELDCLFPSSLSEISSFSTSSRIRMGFHSFIIFFPKGILFTVSSTQIGASVSGYLIGGHTSWRFGFSGFMQGLVMGASKFIVGACGCGCGCDILGCCGCQWG